jgi:hypothetical protein
MKKERDEIYRLISDFPNQIKKAYEIRNSKNKCRNKKNNHFGMGGSYIGGLYF